MTYKIDTCHYLMGLLDRTRSLGDQKLAQSPNDLWKAMKKPFLWEILMSSLISKPSLLWGGQLWHSLKDGGEIIGRSMRSLSTPWVLKERSLSVHWAFPEHSLRDRFPCRSLRDCFGLCQNFEETVVTMDDHLQITERSWRLLGTLWKIVERSSHFVIAQRSLEDRYPCVKGV